MLDVAAVSGLTPDGVALRMLWLLKAREPQLPPIGGKWRLWWLRSGRGTGKTRTGAEWVAEQARKFPKTRWHVIAPTQADVRDTCFEGESGLLSVLAPDEIHRYSKVELLIVLKNGSRIKGFSSEKPDRLRGPQCHGGWLEEVSSWTNAEQTLDMFEFGLRLHIGDSEDTPPRMVVTSTPKRNKITKILAADEDAVITTESTYDNEENLAPAFFERMTKKYEGTVLGMQELHGKVLADAEGALWKSAWINLVAPPEPADILSVRVGWDPAVTSKDKSDLHGVVAVAKLVNGRYVVLEDASARVTPVQGAVRALQLAIKWGAPEVIIEDNQGKDTWLVVWDAAIAAVDSDERVRLRPEHAVLNKEQRATPLTMLYEQSLVDHIAGLDELEDEMLTWVPAERKPASEGGGGTSASPNRIDAVVWAAWGLGVRSTHMKGQKRAGRMSAL
jgi:phage terminase large subunit-like protein